MTTLSGIGRSALIGQDPAAGNKFDGVVTASKNAGRVGRQNLNFLPVHFNLLNPDANAFAFLDLPWQFQAIRVLTWFLFEYCEEFHSRSDRFVAATTDDGKTSRFTMYAARNVKLHFLTHLLANVGIVQRSGRCLLKAF